MASGKGAEADGSDERAASERLSKHSARSHELRLSDSTLVGVFCERASAERAAGWRCTRGARLRKMGGLAKGKSGAGAEEAVPVPVQTHQPVDDGSSNRLRLSKAA